MRENLDLSIVIVNYNTFKLTKDYVITELNGAERNNAQYNGEAAVDRYNDTFRLADRRNNAIGYNVIDGSAITKPDPTEDKTYANRIYFISHHFAIPDDSPYMTADYKRSDDEKAAFFVEVKGPFMRNNSIKNIDTYAEYQDYLRLYRSTIKGNK